MAKAIESVVLAGNGFLRWPGREERVHYRLTVGFDNVIRGIRIAPPDIDILCRPSRHLDLYLHLPEGRRMALNVGPNGHVSPNGRLERSLDEEDWWEDMTPWLPLELPDRVMLVLKCGSVQVFESHATEMDAEAAYQDWKEVDQAEIHVASGKPIQLGKVKSKGTLV